MDPQLSALLSAVLVATGIVAGCFVLEMIFPAEPDPGWASRAEDLLLFLLNSAVLIALAPVLGVAVAGLPSLHLLARLEAIQDLPPFWKQIGSTLVYALVWDFFQYWTHRAQHRTAFLWRFHRTHHDGHAMASSTAVRQSLGAHFISFACIHLPTVSVLGYTGLPYVGSIILFSAWGYYNHANIRIEIPIVNKVFSGPDVHHLHHSPRPEHFGRNLAAFFTFYDRLFGTYVPPQRRTRFSTRPPRSESTGLSRFVRAWLIDVPTPEDSAASVLPATVAGRSDRLG
jgi:sterol desaturase/sphingolipid hydroxylase (fatty acid hydroxylase superfamily)